MNNGTAKILEVECASSHDEDDEDIVYCNCHFFGFDDGERHCMAMEDSSDIDGMMTRQAVLDGCPLKDNGVLVKLKE